MAQRKISSKREKAIRTRWVYKAKNNTKREVEKYKAWLVAKSHKQHQGIHYVNKKHAITLSKNSVFNDRSKHIDTWYHFIRKYIMKKKVQLKLSKSQNQIMDIFTKLLKF